jgi:hypothetical protein
VASDFCRRPGFGRQHPLSIPRVSAVLELCAALGWLDDRCLRTSRAATPASGKSIAPRTRTLRQALRAPSGCAGMRTPATSSP